MESIFSKINMLYHLLESKVGKVNGELDIKHRDENPSMTTFTAEDLRYPQGSSESTKPKTAKNFDYSTTIGNQT